MILGMLNGKQLKIFKRRWSVDLVFFKNDVHVRINGTVNAAVSGHLVFATIHATHLEDAVCRINNAVTDENYLKVQGRLGALSARTGPAGLIQSYRPVASPAADDGYIGLGDVEDLKGLSAQMQDEKP